MERAGREISGSSGRYGKKASHAGYTHICSDTLDSRLSQVIDPHGGGASRWMLCGCVSQGNLSALRRYPRTDRGDAVQGRTVERRSRILPLGITSRSTIAHTTQPPTRSGCSAVYITHRETECTTVVLPVDLAHRLAPGSRAGVNLKRWSKLHSLPYKTACFNAEER